MQVRARAITVAVPANNLIDSVSLSFFGGRQAVVKYSLSLFGGRQAEVK